LPLFPLPNVVLFPGVPLPLHIFEPRYRAMVADALDADRRIGMVLLKPGWEGDYDARPPIYPIGCSGVIVHDTKLDDGRYNIVLHGLDRVRVITEDHERPYRRAVVETMPDPPPRAEDQRDVRELRVRLQTLVEIDLSPDRPLAHAPDGDFIHALAHALDLEPVEKQALLECDTLRRRAQALVDLLDMRRMQAKLPGGSQRPQ
jgi:Lon protease-like protein